jgi:hypothetical protein
MPGCFLTPPIPNAGKSESGILPRVKAKDLKGIKSDISN